MTIPCYGRAFAGLSNWLVVLCVPVALVPASAYSQATPDSSAEAKPLEEVVVTARKIEENVQNIPMSMQVLSAELLDDLDLPRIYDLQFSVPGLVVNNLGLNGAGFSLRGIANQGGSSLSVATFLNGVYLGDTNLAIARMFDLERVEVLKGPQGTLYGRNSTGGTINLVPRSPQHEFSADIEVAYGSFATERVQGHVNVPVGDAAFRLAYIGSEGDGYIRNSVDDRRFAENDFLGLRASVQFDVSEELQVEVMAQRVEDDGESGELWLPRPDNLPDPTDIHLTTVTLANPFLDTVNDGASIIVDYDFGFAGLRSITAYARGKVEDLDDCAGIPILAGCIRGVMPGRHEQWSQEFQLASRGDRAVTWLLGGYFYEDDWFQNFYQLTPVINPAPTIDRHATFKETAVAAFGQGTWSFAEDWGVTAGLRLSNEHLRVTTIGNGTDDSATLVAGETDGDKLSWRLDLQYAAAKEMLVYAGLSTGFKSAGITIQPGGVLDTFEPEDLLAVEAGIKAQLADGRLMLNAAAFHYDFRDLQVSTSTITGNGIIFETDNAAKAEIYGLDSDGSYRVSERLMFSAGLVWLAKREFVEYRNDLTGDTLSGNDLARAPEWTVAAAIDYDQPLRDRGTLSARLEYNYRSDFFYTTDNVPQFSQDSFGLVNLLLNYEAANGKWYLFASGRNLGDADYFLQVFLQASPGYPDTYEAGFGYRF